MRSVAVAGVLLIATLVYAAANGQGTRPPQEPFVGVLDEHPAIRYAAAPVTDRVARLNQALAAGSAHLTFDAASGYARSVLRALDVPAESQLLVFSKTGVQGAATSPTNPRALYFDESVVVGYIPGARALELAAHDAEQGVVFYTLDQSETAAPRFTRQTGCLSCHVSVSTLEVPGLIARSHVVSSQGSIYPQLGSYNVDHRTPLSERWGGWFVTGHYTAPVYAGVAHLGNVTVSMHRRREPSITSNEVFTEWLASTPRARGYASHESDIATLMLFDHQTRAVNLMTRLNWEARIALHGNAVDSEQVRTFVNELADYLLFVDEVAPPGKVTIPAAFVERFSAGALRDRKGRSFRDLDLERRLLRYPCSYMIETDAFDGLPAVVKGAVYRRLWAILSGALNGSKYAHLSAEDRRAIIEILRDTKKDLPAAFRSADSR
jgi:hypothetical protein